jgi:hypothetical protein
VFRLQNAIVDASPVAQFTEGTGVASFEGFCTIMGEWEQRQDMKEKGKLDLSFLNLFEDGKGGTLELARTDPSS